MSSSSEHLQQKAKGKLKANGLIIMPISTLDKRECGT